MSDRPFEELYPEIMRRTWKTREALAQEWEDAALAIAGGNRDGFTSLEELKRELDPSAPDNVREAG